MKSGVRSVSPLAIAITGFLLFGASSWAFAQKGAKIRVDNDPSMKEGSPELVLIEVSDYQ